MNGEEFGGKAAHRTAVYAVFMFGGVGGEGGRPLPLSRSRSPLTRKRPTIPLCGTVALQTDGAKGERWLSTVPFPMKPCWW